MARKNAAAAIAIAAIFIALVSFHGIQSAASTFSVRPRPASDAVLRGHDAFGDFSTNRPGVRRLITVADLPAPYATFLRRESSARRFSPQ